MRIAIINQPFDNLIPPYQNSIALWTYHVAPHVAREHDVIVYGIRFGKEKRLDGQENVDYRLLPKLVPNRLTKRIPGIRNDNLPLFSSRIYFWDYILQVALRLQREKVDIVHIHNFSQFIPFVRAFNPDVKIIIHMNGEWLSQLDYDVMDQRLQETDLIFGSSNYITEKIRERFPQHAERCKTIYNGVDVNLFVSRDDDEMMTDEAKGRLLFVGRVSPEKGVHVLIEAFKIVAEKFQQSRLDIIGPIVALPKEYIISVSDDPGVSQLASLYETDYDAYLQGLIPDHLLNRVRFLGSLPQPELVKYYQMTDVLVNPSFSESFGMSLVEAMACEKPVVATRIGGMVEVTDEGRIGQLVDSGDVYGLADAILELLNDPSRSRLLGKAGRKLAVDRFSWPQVAKSLMVEYENLLNNHG